jgi:hypothetical protein
MSDDKGFPATCRIRPKVKAMRAAVLSFILLIAFGETVLGDSPCSFDATHARDKSRDYSDFRGISLASTPDDVHRVAAELGFFPESVFYVGSKALVSTVNIWTDHEQLGVVSFDRSGRVVRLSLKEQYFCAKPLFVRHFVEDLFGHYRIKPIKEQDDVCFQDVTCFKGVSEFSEQFLILRIGTTAELYIRPASVDASR